MRGLCGVEGRRSVFGNDVRDEGDGRMMYQGDGVM